MSIFLAQWIVRLVEQDLVLVTWNLTYRRRSISKLITLLPWSQRFYAPTAPRWETISFIRGVDTPSYTFETLRNLVIRLFTRRSLVIRLFTRRKLVIRLFTRRNLVIRHFTRLSLHLALQLTYNLIFNVDTRRKWLPNVRSQGLMLKRSTITN